jgi:hypothetical protein
MSSAEVKTNQSHFKVRPGLLLLFVVVLAVAICDTTGINAWLANAPQAASRAILFLAAINTALGWPVWKKGDVNASKRKWAAIGAATILTVSIGTYVLYVETPVKYIVRFHLLSQVASMLFRWQAALAVLGLISPFLARGRSRLVLAVSGLLMLLLWNGTAQQLTESLLEEQSPRKVGANVPFVGCRADGQIGALSAPNGKSMELPITSAEAKLLAYYKSEMGFGVLAPRGWSCFGMYGSSGYSLYVSPQQIVVADLFSNSWSDFSGPAIELVGESGDTSGRFFVAHTIARVFPAHKEFVDNVIAIGIEPATSFTFGPYPKDRLVYRDKEMAEYQTPVNTDGLGTSFRLRKNAIPIRGVAILLGQTPDLLLLSVRLPPGLTALTRTIVQQIELDARSLSQ